MKQFIIDNVALIFSTVFGSGSFYAYWTERSKRNAEAKQANSDALKSMQEAYDKFTEDSLGRYNELKEEMQSLSKKVKELNEELSKERKLYQELEHTYESVKKEYESVKREYESVKTKYEELEHEFHQLKKKQKNLT